MKRKLFLILFVFVLFVGVGSVKADTSGTCFYSGDGIKLVSQTGNYDNFTVAVAINYSCTDSGRCQSSYAAGYTDKNEISQMINFTNAGSFFGQAATDYKTYFYDSRNKKITCPDYIVVSGDATSEKVYFNYTCEEAGDGNCMGYGKKISKQSVPSGDTLSDKVKSVTDLGHYNTNTGASTPGTNPDDDKDDDDDDDVDNSKYIAGIKERAGQTNDNPYELSDTDCVSLLGTGEGSLGQILKDVFWGICIVSVVILIFTSVADFIKAIASSDNDAVSKAFSSSKTRIIATIIMLVLPALLSFIIDVVNSNAYVVTDEFGNKVDVRIGDPSECSITD